MPLKQREESNHQVRNVEKSFPGETPGPLPIDNYDNLSAEEVAEAVLDLSMSELGIVERHEKNTRNRDAVLQAIEAKEDPSVPDNYFKMRANEIMRSLAGMTRSQIELVREFEKEHLARPSVLRAIEQKLSQ